MDARVKPAHDESIELAMSCWVYILASGPGGTLYVGVTNNLVRRVFEHRNGLVRGFTKRYGIKRLVYFEEHARHRWQFKEKRTSNTGLASGRSI
jgi:predicted GIY-YIG superfamily endonuclease